MSVDLRCLCGLLGWGLILWAVLWAPYDARDFVAGIGAGLIVAVIFSFLGWETS